DVLMGDNVLMLDNHVEWHRFSAATTAGPHCRVTGGPGVLVVKAISSALILVAAPFVARAADNTLTINAGQAMGKVSPILYGLMTEEINYSYDGGLYAELVRNRAFLDDPEKPAHWSV